MERLPAVDGDLENGTAGHGDVNNGRIGSGENATNRTLVRATSLTASIANGNALSSTTSSDPEKREDVEIVDWDGPNDPENPYE